jgi:hypothetical protein
MPIGPLHGLPISLKDSFCLEGVQSTVGYVACLNNPPATKNSALVTMLLKLGAVLYVKTNIPQTMMVRIPNKQSQSMSAVEISIRTNIFSIRLETRKTTSLAAPSTLTTPP